MAASTAPACKAAMINIASTALPGIAVTWMTPANISELADEHLFLGTVHIEDDWVYIGNARRRENYTVTVGLYIRKYGNDPQATESRAWEVWSTFKTALRDDLFLPSGSLLKAAGIRKFDVVTADMTTAIPDPESWMAEMSATVAVEADVQ